MNLWRSCGEKDIDDTQIARTKEQEIMKLWKRAAGALKDQKSISAITLSRQSQCRNYDLEVALVKATSHEETCIDYKNAQIVFSWILASPVNLKTLIWALSSRMEKTRSWVVAIKGLMLMHGVFCCRTPAVQSMGRLPFDLSNFKDGHSRSAKMREFDIFIRSYFSFLDQRSALLYVQRNQTEEPVALELVKLKSLQSLLDMLLQIKPHTETMRVTIFKEAMDCVIIEIYDVYSRICKGITLVLMRIYSAGKLEVATAFKILQKAKAQGEAYAKYIGFCRDFGVIKTLEAPKVPQIPEADFKDLERIINGKAIRRKEPPANPHQEEVTLGMIYDMMRSRFDNLDRRMGNVEDFLLQYHQYQPPSPVSEE